MSAYHSGSKSSLSNLVVIQPLLLLMSTEGHYTYEAQMERANLIRQRLGFRSLNGWFRGMNTQTRDQWHLLFAEDPLTGRKFNFGSRDYNHAELIYPQPVPRYQMPRAPIEFTPAAPSTPPLSSEPEQPPWKKHREKEPDHPLGSRGKTSSFTWRGSTKNQTASTTRSTSIRRWKGSVRH
jgi:hypothetical protein